MISADAAALAGNRPSASLTLPYNPPGTNSARASMSTARTEMLRATAARTYQGAAAPIDAQATPPAKNTPHPRSTSARAAARHTDTYDTSVPDASTTRIRSDGENLGLWATTCQPTLYNAPLT
jgi:hypothetical protein